MRACEGKEGDQNEVKMKENEGKEPVKYSDDVTLRERREIGGDVKEKNTEAKMRGKTRINGEENELEGV